MRTLLIIIVIQFATEVIYAQGNSYLTPTSISGLHITGESLNSKFGSCVVSGGDVNGDGYNDLIIGAEGFNLNTGRAYVYFGGPNLDSIADLILTGDSVNKFFAHAISAGDVNGDGFNDIGISSFRNGSSKNRIFIFNGSILMDNIPDTIINSQYGSVWLYEFGKSISMSGNFNADDFKDIIVSTSFDMFGASNFLYYGGQFINTLEFSILHYGGAPVGNAYFVGKVNGDVYEDVVTTMQNRHTYIYFGNEEVTAQEADVEINITNSSSASSAGDVNNDGFSDVIIGVKDSNAAYIFYGGINMDSLADRVLKGVTTIDSFGCSVCKAGDVNGDGFSDILIGSSGFSSGRGRVYVFYGGTNMDTKADVIISGQTPNSAFGNAVSNAGDLNSDGNADIVIGANEYNSNTGRAYIYSNLKSAELINPPNNSTFNQTIINFIWSKVDFVSNYVITIATDSSLNNIILRDTLSDTNKIVTGFQRNTNYYWNVEAIDSYGVNHESYSSFKTIPPVYLNLRLVMQGLYYPAFNQLIRKDTVTAVLRKVNSPYGIVDSAKSVIDSVSLSGIFSFNNSYSGYYYIVARHFNSIETWSKSGGTILINDGNIYTYDFTSSINQAYGNNLKLKGSKYCIYSGDVNQDNIVDVTDLIKIYNDAILFTGGRYLSTDLDGNDFVDISDIALCYNNAISFVGTIRP